MAVTKDSGRQTVLCAIVDLNYNDMTSGVSTEVMDVEPGTIVLGGYAAVETADNAGTSAVLDVGDGDAANLYVDDLDLKTAGESEAFDVTELGKYYPNGGGIFATRTAVGTAATAGKARVVMFYIVTGRVNEVRTN
jgi:hypothetical protein